MKHIYNVVADNPRRPLSKLLLTALLSAGVITAHTVQAAQSPAPDTRNEVSRWLYDANGRLTGINNPLNYTSQIQYDSLGRPASVSPYLEGATVPQEGAPVSGGNARYGNVYYSYDSFDYLTKVVDPRGLITDYTYDGFGNLLTQSSKDTKTTINTYDNLGRRSTSTDANNKTTTFDYTNDGTNRLAKVTYTDGTFVTLSYYAGNDTVNVGGRGRLKEINDPSHSQTISYTYDILGRVSSIKTASAGIQPTTVSYTYNADGKLDTISYPSGRTIKLTYTDVDGGRVSKVTTTYKGKTTALVSNISYRPFGKVENMRLANGTDASRSYDEDGRLLSYSLKGVSSATKSDTRTLNIDAASRITGYKHSPLPRGITQDPGDQTFAYDEIDRIKAASANYNNATLDYSYDNNGNRVSKQTNSVVDTYSTDNGSNKLASVTPGDGRNPINYTYDDNGNITFDGTYTYGYDVRNRLVNVKQGNTEIANYQYNILGKRFYKSTAAGVTYFQYDLSGKLIAETDGAGRPTMEYLYFGNLPVAVVKNTYEANPKKPPTTELYTVQADHINTPRVITDDNKNVVWQWVDTDPFGARQPSGNPKDPTKSLTVNLRFPGQYYDAETRLYHNGFRDYNPELGRYMQSDPIGLAGRSFSTYAYVNANPLSAIDPTGRIGETNDAVTDADIIGSGALTPREQQLMAEIMNQDSLQDLQKQADQDQANRDLNNRLAEEDAKRRAADEHPVNKAADDGIPTTPYDDGLGSPPPPALPPEAPSPAKPDPNAGAKCCIPIPGTDICKLNNGDGLTTLYGPPPRAGSINCPTMCTKNYKE